MKKYNIIDNEGHYWSESKMKPSNLPDENKNYRIMGYWSNYTDEHALKCRKKYFYITGQIERFMMFFLSRIKTSLINTGEKK